MTNNLTMGQVRVREIIYEYLPLYQKLMKEEHFRLSVKEDCIDDYRLLINEIKNKFSSDPVITSDSFTSQSLYHHEISNQYLTWLFFNNPYEEIDGGEHSIKTDKFVYDPTFLYDSKTREDMFAYQGGHKYDSTYSCLFGLAEGKTLITDGWVSTYYEKEGVLKCGGGGSHRLLANVLWGSHSIKPSKIYLVKEVTTDRELHDSILKLERLMRGCDSFFAFKDYLSSEEADNIKSFSSTVGETEIKTIKNYIADKYIKERQTFTICDLSEMVNDLQMITSMTIFKKMILKFKLKFKIRIDYTSHFERWLIEDGNKIF
jgi:hypothetical protein